MPAHPPKEPPDRAVPSDGLAAPDGTVPPDGLAAPSAAVVRNLGGDPDGAAWLRRLPRLVEEFTARWDLRVGRPYPGGSCSWAAPVRRADGAPAVLKLSWPHPEAACEALALRHWAAVENPAAVRPCAWDEERWALLLERCEPGTGLLSPEQPATPVERLTAGLDLLRELWTRPRELPRPDACPPELAEVCEGWADLVEERFARTGAVLGADPGPVRRGAALLRELPRRAPGRVLLHGDFNPGNVLTARRRSHVAIDPKPMMGDPAYDPWPLLDQLPARLPLRARLLLAQEHTGQPADRLAAWGLARTVEYALWSADRGGTADARAALAGASALADLAQA
ncbi:aminoglycoside phosphotransferase family protein [Streptomyces sp. XM4193]|uniref:aminoglycoside phosphotransferase family protein n=1 Tax=Streptomyces sp. XM4193 TaxID=2929782 RepID=UPI001FF8AE21|nr:aminoglycoside phosphotransferase family protein [Streptomyces sp. XM4193]MCK1797228.1 aminoglycoside phosphotransferase family protein [Streptomyces sp. XM4193]